MNERIKELAVKAGIEFTYDPTETPIRAFVECWEDEMEKFAELIVQECARIARATPCPYEEDEVRQRLGHTWDMASLEAGREIKQHFRVEEQEKVAPKPKCSVCGTTENVKYMGGYQPYLCDSIDCIPF